ncbi:hypothetical protein [Nocardia sp. BMG51109]|uniref:hypothetical protein n=1 Tax=Nocardia sp. BMG51109 TaxID=1056816 RepID=UPI0004642F60|nr:hypothetical protein [Nocardia sp. BMG51109]
MDDKGEGVRQRRPEVREGAEVREGPEVREGAGEPGDAMAVHPVPRPPFSTDLLADLHADNVSPELSEQLWPQVRDDPESLRFLRSLDDVTVELQSLGQDSEILHPMPSEVGTRLDRLLDDLAHGNRPETPAPETPVPGDTAVPPLPPGDNGTPTTRPMAAVAPDEEDPAELIRLDARRSRRLRWLTAAAAVIAIVVGALIGVDAVRGPDPAPRALPTTPAGAVELDDDLPAATLLSAIGRNEVTGPLAGPGALTGCVAAAGFNRPVLGSMNVTYRGRPAVVIILTGPQPPKITALVVGTGCGPGNAQKLEMRDIG